MRFWDASAIIPILLREPGTSAVQRLLKTDDDLVVWWGTAVECASALARRAREGSLTDTTEHQARARLDQMQTIWNEVLPNDAVREFAQRLLRIHPLRAADSLQLAAALVWTRQRPRGSSFVCLDDRLCDAADLEGFQVLP
jgi:uncharacterized protein